MTQLHHPLRPGQVTQRVGAEIVEPGTFWQGVGDHVVGRPGKHRLPPVRQVAQPRGPVDRRADVVALVPQPRGRDQNIGEMANSFPRPMLRPARRAASRRLIRSLLSAILIGESGR